MKDKTQKERRAARTAAIVLFLAALVMTIVTAKSPNSGLDLVGSIVAIGGCYFFAGWAFGISLSPGRDQAASANSQDESVQTTIKQ